MNGTLTFERFQRVTARLAALAARMARIAEAHHKKLDEHGGSYGDCNECSWVWPCPTYVWATTARDPILDTWDPSDDEDDTDNPEGHA